MQRNSVTLSALCLLALAASSGEPVATPPVPPAPPPLAPPVPPVQPAPLHPPIIAAQSPAAMFANNLTDLQGTDAAKQEAAKKALVDAGQRGHIAVAGLLKNPNPEIVKRAVDVQQEIDKRSQEKYRLAAQREYKMQDEELTVKSVEELRQLYLQAATYSSQNNFRKQGYEKYTGLQKVIQRVETSIKELAGVDQQIKAEAGMKGIKLAALESSRADHLNNLHRRDDAMKALERAILESGKGGRHVPAMLKLKVEIAHAMHKPELIEAACKTILQDYPRSLETKFAHSTLIDFYSNDDRWDEAITQLKAAFAAFPLDEEIQDSAYSMLETLMDEKQQYKHVATLSDWLMQVLPVDRLKPEVAKNMGGCAEYVLKDYAKAVKAYQFLRDTFPDMIEPKDVEPALKRVNAKIAGTFPKEPSETDPAPLGTLAQFLKALRTRDKKLTEAVVPKDELEEYSDRFDDGEDSVISACTFGDFIVKKVEGGEDAAKFIIDYYDASSEKPISITQTAIKEDGRWKIQWEEPEEEQSGPAPAPGVPNVSGKSSEKATLKILGPATIGDAPKKTAPQPTPAPAPAPTK